MLTLAPYSLGVGDRFSLQAQAQLRAFALAAHRGVEITPVWNKSNREHLIVGSEPQSVARAAQEAVTRLRWNKAWHVDADHIRLDTVDRFVPCSDFFTIDVAESIGRPTPPDQATAFVERHPELSPEVRIPGVSHVLKTNKSQIQEIAKKYLVAIAEAGRLYRYIVKNKGEGTFITEVSMDETDFAQTPVELLVILAALSDEKVQVQTIAPRFSGRFNKGVDYAGNVAQFEKEFTEDLAVIKFAVSRYGLPENLKLSVHSGSDKFSIYAPIRRVLRKTGAGLHLKTAGTTWLEEITGLALAGGEGLALAKEIYAQALKRREELSAPYAAVIDIDPAALPAPSAVARWSYAQYAAAVRHDPQCREFNPSL
ncbi:MAG TPA: tagaturonate epimerase family protein, partial [Syntrophorhabdaceae bacterium]|nr:tagaturonate epimerase family protein [Syntrophorhabdaceae bacterium]